MSYHEEHRHSSAINSAERTDLSKAVANSMTAQDCYFFLDGINNQSEEMQLLLADVCEIFLTKASAGKVILTSTEVPAFFPGAFINETQVSEYSLPGLSIEECKKLLQENDVEIDKAKLEQLVHAVSGHPLSITLFCQLFSRNKENKENHRDFEELSSKTVEAAQEYLITKAIESLPDDQKSAVLRLSVIPYGFSADLIDGYIETRHALKLILRELKRKSLLSFDGIDYSVHDLIRSSCLSLLSRNEKTHHHREMEKLWHTQLSEPLKQGEGILYKDGFKWAFHAENSSVASSNGSILEQLLNLSRDELDALWAIQRFGYPFDYVSEELIYSQEKLQHLIELGLVQPYEGEQTATFGTRLYETVEFPDDKFSHVFLVYLCISRGISNHLGYIDIPKLNYAFHTQVGIMCAWEHHIELMPLPPLTRAEHANHIESLEQQFAARAYEDRSVEHRMFLRKMIDNGIPEDAPEEPDFEMEQQRCPIFGHCCPGGAEQAAECRADEEAGH
jgi:hypothetical protein